MSQRAAHKRAIQRRIASDTAGGTSDLSGLLAESLLQLRIHPRKFDSEVSLRRLNGRIMQQLLAQWRDDGRSREYIRMRIDGFTRLYTAIGKPGVVEQALKAFTATGQSNNQEGINQSAVKAIASQSRLNESATSIDADIRWWQRMTGKSAAAALATPLRELKSALAEQHILHRTGRAVPLAPDQTDRLRRVIRAVIARHGDDPNHCLGWQAHYDQESLARDRQRLA